MQVDAVVSDDLMLRGKSIPRCCGKDLGSSSGVPDGTTGPESLFAALMHQSARGTCHAALLSTPLLERAGNVDGQTHHANAGQRLTRVEPLPW